MTILIKVLIVEDDYRIAEIHEKFLEELDGITVISKALTGKEALEIAKQHDVDLVLLDLYLPDIFGENLLKKLRKLKKNIDFVIISAASETHIVERLLRSGIFDYMIKPVIKERLLETIERYIDFVRTLKKKHVVEQKFLDSYFGFDTSDDKNSRNIKDTPKGIDPLTLEKVKEIMEDTTEGITAEKLGEKIGASRTTARRYLEFLISEGEVTADLQYGTIGRPERIYFKVHVGET